MPKGYPILNLLIGLSISFSSLSQVNNGPSTNINSYSLLLPDAWMRPRLIKTINEIIPLSLDEWKNLAYCSKCRTGYSIRLVMDSVITKNPQYSALFETGSVPRPTYTFSFQYGFAASLVLFDSLEHPVSRLKLVDGDEIFTYSKDYTLPVQGAGARTHFIVDTSGKIVNDKTPLDNSKLLNQDIPKHNARSALTDSYLLDICEQRIFALRKKFRNSVDSNLP